MKLKLYNLIVDCVETGVETGWRRAHKHSDSPEPGTIWARQTDAILENFAEYLTFEDEGVE